MWNPKSWWKNSIKYGRKIKNKSLRKKVRRMLLEGNWEHIPKKLFIVPDDGS